MWVTPKTNWVQTDFFNVTDYNRIVGNILYLKTLAEKLYGSVEYEDMVKTKTYSSMFYAREMNAIENNLESVNIKTLQLDIGETKSYSANDSTPLWEEYNRIESACFKLYNYLLSRQMMLQHLEIHLSSKQFGKRVKYNYNEVMSHRLNFRFGMNKGVVR